MKYNAYHWKRLFGRAAFLVSTQHQLWQLPVYGVDLQHLIPRDGQCPRRPSSERWRPMSYYILWQTSHSGPVRNYRLLLQASWEPPQKLLEMENGTELLTCLIPYMASSKPSVAFIRPMATVPLVNPIPSLFPSIVKTTISTHNGPFIFATCIH